MPLVATLCGTVLFEQGVSEYRSLCKFYAAIERDSAFRYPLPAQRAFRNRRGRGSVRSEGAGGKPARMDACLLGKATARGRSPAGACSVQTE
jgi:hypothetical protein